jgi:hypothetical protein
VAIVKAPQNYELPIAIEIASSVHAKRVKVGLKSEGKKKFKVIEAENHGKKWFVTAPCAMTKSTGDLLYYVRILDDHDDVIQTYGSSKEPHTITITDYVAESDIPHTADDSTPKKCEETGDLPPGMTEKKSEGSGCEQDDECESGLVCIDNDNGAKWCHEPPEGYVPKEKGKPDKKWWIGADFDVDFQYGGAEQNICADSNKWSCTYAANGTIYDVGYNLPSKSGASIISIQNMGATPGTGGKLLFGNMRAIASLSYLVVPQLLIGLHLGASLYGYNSSKTSQYYPEHVEARATFFLTRGSVRPYLALGGGFAEFEAKGTNQNVLCDSTNGTVCASGSTLTVHAYSLGGLFFVAPGFGTWFMVSDSFVIDAQVRFIAPLPTFAPAIGLSLGGRIGL